jgi:hypothetical protein
MRRRQRRRRKGKGRKRENTRETNGGGGGLTGRSAGLNPPHPSSEAGVGAGMLVGLEMKWSAGVDSAVLKSPKSSWSGIYDDGGGGSAVVVWR